jgi:excisionase family DNA binding protein
VSVMTQRNSTSAVPPDLLTVEDAARVLQIGRTLAYELVRRWFSTDGAEGLPAVRVGRLLRVPRHALEDLIGGPITWPIPSREPIASPTPIAAFDARSHSTRRRRSLSAQQSLPLPS